MAGPYSYSGNRDVPCSACGFWCRDRWRVMCEPICKTCAQDFSRRRLDPIQRRARRSLGVFNRCRYTRGFVRRVWKSFA